MSDFPGLLHRILEAAHMRAVATTEENCHFSLILIAARSDCRNGGAREWPRAI